MLKPYYMYDKDKASDRYNKHLIIEEHYLSPDGKHDVDFYLFNDKTKNLTFIQLEIDEVVVTFQPLK